MKSATTFVNLVRRQIKQMTEQELIELWSEMRKQRVDKRLLPYEPSPIEFAARVAKIAYAQGWKECKECWDLI